jgi:hypothetical protein
MSKNNSPPQASVETTVLDDLLDRVKGEYKEMPGMCVTRTQAQRLWGLDSATCEVVLATLLERGVVRRTPRGMYVKY